MLMFNRDLYIPRTGIIEEIKVLTPDTKLFKVVLKDRKPASSQVDEYKPGQFVQFSLLGWGEVPISITSSPTQKGYLEFSVRKVGAITAAIHELKLKDKIGIRGPYGNCFPLEDMQYKDLIFIGGGCGLAPLRSAINYIFDRRENYGEVSILYGARTKQDIVFKNEIYSWRDRGIAEVHISVDCGPEDPGCSIGLVTSLFNRLKDIRGRKIFICGPSIMIRSSLKQLLEMGASADDIIVTLERYMKCGVGKCGHCYLVNKYVCTDGPVFSYRQLRSLKAVEEVLI